MQSNTVDMAISRQAAKKILKEVGAERVGDDAAIELSESVNKFAYDLARKAVKLASHAKRSTVKKEDVELAS